MNECCSITLTLLDATGVDDSGAPQLLSQSKQWLFDWQLGDWEPCLVVEVKSPYHSLAGRGADLLVRVWNQRRWCGSDSSFPQEVAVRLRETAFWRSQSPKPSSLLTKWSWENGGVISAPVSVPVVIQRKSKQEFRC